MKKLSLLGLLLLFGACNKAAGDGTVAAKLNGQPILMSELDESIKNQRQKIDMELYDLRSGGLQDLIEQKLLADEAKKQNVSVDQLLKQEVADKITPPTDEELKALYDSRKQGDSQPFDEIKDDIRTYVLRNKTGGARQAFLSKLRQTAKIENLLQAPRVEVAEDDSPAIGPKGAPVKVIEFTDYQCPFCGRARATVNQVLDTYKDKVRYVLRDFPLSFHKDSFLAHEAAHCAGDQEKYWDFNKKLFGNQTAIQESNLKTYAKDSGLNMKKFEACLSSHKYREAVQKNLEAGSVAGVTGTPAFFINGILLSGARPFPDFKKLIDQELQR